MRRVPLALLTLLASTALASAQTAPRPVPDIIVLPRAVAAPSPDLVVARVMSFDRDRDGRITRAELPERMHNLLASDVSGDDALDRAEIRALAMAQPARPVRVTVPGISGGGGGYVFGDAISLSTRAHVEGALEDLRLDNYTKDRARPIVSTFMDRLETNASAALVKTLEPMLAPAQLDTLKATLARQLSGQRGLQALASKAEGNVTTFFVGGNLEQLILQARLPAEQRAQALAALERFKEQLRPGEAERPVLLERLATVLSDEERENFGAALARRPLVKSGLPPAINLHETLKVVPPDGAVVSDGVFRTPLAAPPVVVP